MRWEIRLACGGKTIFSRCFSKTQHVCLLIVDCDNRKIPTEKQENTGNRNNLYTD